jgi:hypothetical protein
MDNPILYLATVVGKGLVYLLSASMFFLVFVTIYVAITGDMETFWYIHFTEKGIFFTNSLYQEVPRVVSGQGEILFSGLSAVLGMGCYILIIRESLKVVRSIKSLETFRIDNIRSFQRIGKLILVLLVLNAVILTHNGHHWDWYFEFNPTYLLGTLVCYILAEIFREGNKLMEEQKLTI